MAKAVAKGIHDHAEFKLGALVGPDHWDTRTVNLMSAMSVNVDAPRTWDFDKRRKKFQLHMWGNDQYGDCELAARANYINRIQRAEQKSTSLITDQDVIDLYKQMTGCATPGDNNDSGMTTIDNFNQWRHGWLPTSRASHPSRVYSLDAFGYIDPQQHDFIRLAAYLFNGTLLGIDMPYTAAIQTQNGQPWDYVPDGGWQSEPGSWGGHAVYCKRYSPTSLYVLSWAREIEMTDAFVKNYVVEAYCGIESFRTWDNYKNIFDVTKLIQQMKDIGVKVES